MAYLQYVELQRYEPTKEEIARHFNRNSAEAVFAELKGYGFPVCVICGATPVAGEHCRTRCGRKAPGVEGEPLELPSPANAAHLFERTRGFIKHEIAIVSSLKETLQGRRFMSEGARGAARGTAGRLAWGGEWFPNPDLTRLIGSYIVEYGGDPKHVELLLEVLHPNPAEANRKQLSRFIYGIDHDAKGGPKQRGEGLIQRVQQCAALIRGLPEIGTGRKDVSITPSEQIVVWNIQAKLEEGLPEEVVRREVRERWSLPPDDYHRLHRLAKEGLA